MSSPVGSSVTDFYSFLGISQTSAPKPILAKRDPNNKDLGHPLGQLWINEILNNIWGLSSVSAGLANWISLGGGGLQLTTLTGGSGGSISPSGGNISLAGTANQIQTSGVGSTITWSLIGPYTPSSYTAHGVLIGESSSSIVATTAGTNGQVMLGSTGADPAFGTLTTSTGILYTIGAASLAIDIQNGGFAVVPVSGTSASGVVQNLFICSNSGQTSISLPATAAVGSRIKIAGTNANTGGIKITQGAGQIIRSDGSATTLGVTGNLATAAANTSIEILCVVANTDFLVIASTGTLVFT